MQLITPVYNEYIELNSSSPTVIAPGEKLTIQVSTTAFQQCEIISFNWVTPLVIDSNPVDYKEEFPIQLEKNQNFEFEINFNTSSNEEGYGDTGFRIDLKTPEGREIFVEWSTWISVYKPVTASDNEELDIGLRQRLIDVVNAKTQNGYIFLGNYLSFFNNYLNIQVPDSIATIITEEMGLPNEGLPVDSETLLLLMLGKTTFYGITKLELIAEEDCIESDDKFEMNASREVQTERMDDA